MKRIIFFLLVLCVQSVQAEHDKTGTWTRLYYCAFSQAELDEHKQRRDLYFEQHDVAPFSQLIFSWNAFRPAKGYFTFFVQVRDACTKQWSGWHKMFDWGARVQRSYQSLNGAFSSYYFVRLETEGICLADGFRIKIVGTRGLCLSNIRAFAVSVSNFSAFTSEVNDNKIHKLPAVYIEGIPRMSQLEVDHEKNDAICSPTSCSMVASYLTGTRIDPAQFAESAYDAGLGAYGSWPFNTAHAFEIGKGSLWFFVSRLNSFTQLHARLKHKIPVIVSIRGPIEGGARPYANGHLLVVVGWDPKKRQVICHDPAFSSKAEVEHRYPLKSFLQAWECSHRLSYLVEPVTPRSAPPGSFIDRLNFKMVA